MALAVLGMNAAAGYGRAALRKRPSKLQWEALTSLRASTKRVLAPDLTLDRSVAEAEKEISSRYMTYSGEEVPKMQILRLAAAKAALPPQSHAGSIDARGLVSEGTRWFLDNPMDSLLPNVPLGTKLQARVHVERTESLDFFQTSC